MWWLMTVVVLTAADQLPVLMAHNHHSPDVHIVLLEGIFKQLESRQLEKRNIQLSLFYLEFFWPVMICGQLTGALLVGTMLHKKMLIQSHGWTKKMTQYGETQREEEDRLVGEQRGEVAQSSSVRPAASLAEGNKCGTCAVIYLIQQINCLLASVCVHIELGWWM